MARTSAFVRRVLVASLALTFAAQFNLMMDAQETGASQPAERSSPGASSNGAAAGPTINGDFSPALPDSPGATREQDSPTGAAGSVSAPPGQTEASRQNEPSSDQLSKPAGTAAAEPLKPSGVAASEPAGAAVAPGKQHRMRSLLITVGAVAGAGVALGTVYALSHGTSSKPPGAH
jgi:hypothetical protein